MPEETDMQYTVCHCNHLTAFSSMMVPPNPLPRLTLALFKEGYVLFVVVGTILGLYLVGLVVLRKFDMKDELKVSSMIFSWKKITLTKSPIFSCNKASSKRWRVTKING